MLVSFTVGNFLSFKENVTLKLEADSISEHSESNTFSTSFRELRLLKGCVLYGANSCGKSNLLKAINFVKWFIVNSSKDFQAEEEIDVDNFLLNTSNRVKPSNFEIVFIVNGSKYRYGFEVDRKQIHKEWLYRTKKIKESKVFSRDGQNIDIDSKFKSDISIFELTRSNALFISVAAQFNNSIAIEILKILQDITFATGISDKFHIDYTANLLNDTLYKKFIDALLKGVDLGFENIETQQVDITKSIKKSKLPKEIINLMLKTNHKDFLISTEHNVYDEKNNFVEKVHFNLMKHESQGTRKFFALAGPIIETLINGKVLLIDEFDARLHPILSKAIIKLFNSKENNPKNAQLIFATHDSSFLSSKIFRRDQVILINKDKYGASEIETLFDRKVRKDASFEKDYLLGKYDAIPKISLPYQLKLF